MTKRQSVGQILKAQGIITEDQVQEALAVQRESGGAFGGVLKNLGYATDVQVTTALGVQAGMETVDLEAMDLAPDLIEKVSPSIATIYRVVPIRFEDNTLTLAMAAADNVKALDDLQFMLQCEVRGALADGEAVDRAIHKYYAGQSESVEDLLAEMESETSPLLQFDYGQQSTSIDLETLEDLAHSMPVVKLLNLILLQAIRDESSDIHFEPFEAEFRVRYRVDGVLYEMVPPPRHLALALTSRIKVMSNLNIAERRVPQDGRIQLNISGNPVDLRVSTLPTVFGESVVMRILDRSVVSLDLERIGLRPNDLRTLRRLIHRPHGIILVTGPTGSGKTTTLYSALNEANDVGIKIITTENPVEYDLPGIIQVEINENIGLTFAICLRSILRQDPDKVLVGEIRDLETAEIAIQASLTGHVVFSTLHTNDAPSAIIRLIEMGVEPHLIGATLEAIVAQRLVRTICPKCKEEYEPESDALDAIGLTPDRVRGKKFYYGRGCEHCNNTGYRGRSGVFEIMTLNDALRREINRQASTAVLRELARQQGMQTLREAGLLKIFDGETTIEEVLIATHTAA